MKKKVLVTSILSIIMCMSLIIGATFALFTSESKVNIAVTSGKVDVKASVAELTTYSNDTITDVPGTFENGGTATVNGTSVVLDRLTPMDKVVLEIEITNSSNVAFKQRVSFGCAETEQSLYDQLLIGLSNDGSDYTYYSNYKTAWTNGTVMEQGASETTSLYLSIELPAWVGNEWQDKSCAITLAVEAVQGNAETTDDVVANEVVIVNSQAELDAAVASMASGGTVILGGGEWTEATIAFDDAKTINVRGYKVTGTITVNAPNGTVNVYNDADSVLVVAVADESLHLFGTIGQMLVQRGRAVLETGASITDVRLQPVADFSAKIEVSIGAAIENMAIDAAAGSVSVKIAEEATVTNVAIEGAGDIEIDNEGTLEQPLTVTTASELASALNSGIAEVTLGADIGIVPQGSGEDLVPQFSVNKKVTLNLNGHMIYVDYDPNAEYTYTPALFEVVEGGDVTVNGEGVITAEAGNNNSYGINVNGGKLTVNGGEWYGALTAIQVQKGELVVNDGFFDMAPTCKAAVPQYAKYVINCIDANFKDGTAKITVYNGTFVNFDPSTKPEGAGTTYVADDSAVYEFELENGETWYRVEKIQYVSTQEELLAAVANGGFVTLEANIETDSAIVVPEGSFLALDLNGYDIKGTNDGALIENHGEMVIEGDGNSCVYTTDLAAQGRHTVLNYGTMTINGGRFGDKNTDETDANDVNRGNAVRNYGTMTINGGYFTACDNFTPNETDNQGYAYAIANGSSSYPEATMTINYATVYGSINGVLAADGGTLTVKDGSYTLGDGTENNLWRIVYTSGNGEVVIDGGTYTRNVNNNNAFFGVYGTGKIVVNDGTFTDSVHDYIKVDGSASTIINGGWFSGDISGDMAQDNRTVIQAYTQDSFKNALYSVKEGGTILLEKDIDLVYDGKHPDGVLDTYIAVPNVTIDLQGHTITVTHNGYVFGLAASGITLKNGSITLSDPDSTAYPLYVTSGAKNVVIENVSINGGMQVIGNSSATLKDVNITATTYYNVYLEYKSTVTIESGTFTSNTEKVHVHIYTALNTDTVTVNGGTFDGSDTPTYAGNGTVTVNTAVSD